MNFFKTALPHASTPLLSEHGLRARKRLGAMLALPMAFVALDALAAPKSQFETPPVLQASKLLAPEILKGPYHQVAERVTSDGYFNNYHIDSKFGAYDVEGLALLEVRISEMAALAELDKISSTKVFQDAALKAGKGIVMAPVTIVKKTAQTVSDPQAIVDTVAGIPEGAEKLFSWAYRNTKGAVVAVGDAVTGSGSQSSSDSGTSFSDTLDSGAKFGLEYIGYNKNQRAWFKKLQINPYTTNTTLKDEVVRVAGIETAVGTAFKFVPGIGILGQLGTINRWYDRAEKLSLYEDPDEIRKKNKQGLTSLGVPDDLIEKFLNNKAYSPWTRRFITASLVAIGPKVPGHAGFIRAANEATNEPSSLYFVVVADCLERLHATRPLKAIVSSLQLPAAVTVDKALYVPVPADYLFWTETTAGIFADFKARVMKETSFSSAEIVVRGKVSALTRKNLEAMGAKVTEGQL
jgi:hypothetical protein